MLHCPIVKRLVVAVDGPSGAGKGTVARAVARALGYRHIDTGAMYRAVAWRAIATGVALEATEDVAAVAARASFDLRDGVIAIDGHDVTSAIRTPDMDKAAALVARNAPVRDVLVARQRALGAGGGVVMEGRDIGSVIFPQADFRFFLHADPAERARRRAGEGGQDQIAERDRIDSSRKTSPLACPAGAISIDSTHLTLAEVVETMARPIAAKLEAA